MNLVWLTLPQILRKVVISHQCEYIVFLILVQCVIVKRENTPACTQTDSIFGLEMACESISEHLNDKIFQGREKRGVPTAPLHVAPACLYACSAHLDTSHHSCTTKLKSTFQNTRSTMCESVNAQIC